MAGPLTVSMAPGRTVRECIGTATEHELTDLAERHIQVRKDALSEHEA